MEEPILYEYNGNLVEELPYFLYEVCIYKISLNNANLLSSKYYTSNKLVKLKDIVIMYRFKDFNIQRFISLIGAPRQFIRENNLKIHKVKKRKYENKQSRNTH